MHVCGRRTKPGRVRGTGRGVFEREVDASPWEMPVGDRSCRQRTQLQQLQAPEEQRHPGLPLRWDGGMDTSLGPTQQ